MTTRSTAQATHERFIALVLELDPDKCLNTYGVAPCTAAAGVGNECHNTWASCQDKANFTRGTVTHKFCNRGLLVPGETVRPLVASISVSPTEIIPSKGLAMRSISQVVMVDEPAADHLEDPYYATRAAAATGTWWSRFLARNTNLVGRPARVRQGYKVQPWDWTVFQTSAYIIDAVRGPDEQGRVTLVLSDVLKLADRNVVPAPTSGALTADLADVAHTGYVAGATAGTLVLGADASPVDDAYNTHEAYIRAGTGEGQRRVITDYVGATRTCTLASNWLVQPDATSVVDVSPLSINVGSGKGTQYADPATSGKAEFIRVGDETIQYTAKSGDVLSWPDATYRNKWGTTLGQHSAGDAVQLCRAWVGKRPWEVLRDICTESGIAAGYLDTATWTTEDTTYFNTAEITAIITEPEKASDLLGELLVDLNAVMWWDPVAQKVKLLANQPRLDAVSTALTEDELGRDSVRVETLDEDRITRAAQFYTLRDATGNKGEAKNYQAASIYVDADAESANEYGDVRSSTRYSRFLSAANGIYNSAVVARKVVRLRDAPKRITARLDPRNEVALGDLVSIAHPKVPDFTGAAKAINCRVVRLKDAGAHFECTFLTTGFKRSRYAFIAPNGQPDYTAASEAQRKYCYIATTATGKMSNGDDGYYIS